MPKEFKTYIEQIELLKAKGLIIPNEALALYALKNYGYFKKTAKKSVWLHTDKAA